MHIRFFCAGVIAAAVAVSAMAQSTQPADDSMPCRSEKAELERRMDLARSKGQMLLRRQLADQLSTLQAGCKQLPAERNRMESIEALEKEIQVLRAKLDAAEAQLLQLKSQTSR